MSVRMKLNTPGAALFAGAFRVVAVAGCASEGTDVGSQNIRAPAGMLSLALQVQSDLSVDKTLYEIDGNGLSLRGSLPVSGSGTRYSATIPQIPVGTRYDLRLTVASGDPSVGCAGAASFDIAPGAVTVVDVTLVCDELDDGSASAMPNGTFNGWLDAGPEAVSAIDFDGSRDAGAGASSGADAGAISLEVGLLDAGASPYDAGATLYDAGASLYDAGASPYDAGASAYDANVPTEVRAPNDAGSSPLVGINEVESKDAGHRRPPPPSTNGRFSWL